MHHCCQNAPNDDVILGSQPLDTWQCKFPSRSLAFADPRGSTSLKTLGVKVGSDLPGSLNTQKIPHKILQKGLMWECLLLCVQFAFPNFGQLFKKQNMAILSTPIKKTNSNSCSATKLPHRFKCSNCFSVRSSRPCLAEFVQQFHCCGGNRSHWNSESLLAWHHPIFCQVPIN